jgi:hypothetical protein
MTEWANNNPNDTDPEASSFAAVYSEPATVPLGSTLINSLEPLAVSLTKLPILAGLPSQLVAFSTCRRIKLVGVRQYGAEDEFADAYNDDEVVRNEPELAHRLRSFADAIDLGDHLIPDDVNVRREAFSCAAWLQDLHPIMQNMIVEREEARTARPS